MVLCGANFWVWPSWRGFVFTWFCFSFLCIQACCPVCREPISKDTDPLRDAAQPIELQNAPDFRLTSDLKSLQVRMANLYMHQMQRGGIIDSNADESNVISIQSEDAGEQVIF